MPESVLKTVGRVGKGAAELTWAGVCYACSELSTLIDTFITRHPVAAGVTGVVTVAVPSAAIALSKINGTISEETRQRWLNATVDDVVRRETNKTAVEVMQDIFNNTNVTLPPNMTVGDEAFLEGLKNLRNSFHSWL